MSLPVEYFVRWRNQAESFRVLAYDPSSREFAPTPYFDPHLERLVTDTEIAFLIDGEYILFLQANGILETGRVSVQVAANDFPRLEFCRLEDSVPEILATVSRDACLRVTNLREGEFDPNEDHCFNFFDTVQLSRAGLVAARVREIQLVIDSSGEYVGSHDDRLIANTQSGETPPPAVPYLLTDSQRRFVAAHTGDVLAAKP